MKKIFIPFLIILIIFSLSACGSTDNINSVSKIVSPVNGSIPIAGTWQIKTYKLSEDNVILKKEADKWLNVFATFSNLQATLGEDSCKNPNYKIKVVNTNSYFLYSSKQNADFLNIKEKDVQVISITSENNFFHEFIRINENLMLINIDGIFMYLQPTKDSAPNTLVNFSNLPGTATKPIDPNSAAAKSIVLIGLRSSKKSSTPLDNVGKDYNYRTLLISYTDKKINPIIETDSLLVPRMTGFWCLDIKRNSSNNHSVDTLFAFPSATQQSSPIPSTFVNSEQKIINFIGNDYISIEKIIKRDASSQVPASFSSTLQVLSLDNLNSKESVKLTQLCGLSSLSALQEGAASPLNSLGNNGLFSKEVSEYNWGVFRRNGHWVLKGRLSPLSNATDISPDFNIPLVAPKKSLIGYDDLSPTWSSIKERVPDAIDAYTSPSKDIVITITNTILSVYQLENNNISLSPLAQIKLKENETIIMDQWAQGDYTDSWTKAFYKNVVSIPQLIKLN